MTRHETSSVPINIETALMIFSESESIQVDIAMWPFKKKKIQPEKQVYVFIPAEDITAFECASLLSQKLWYLGFDDEYLAAQPEPMRRHFKPVLVERQTPSADAPASIP